MSVKFALELFGLILVCLIFIAPVFLFLRVSVKSMIDRASTYTPQNPRGTGKQFRRKGR